MGKGNVNVIKGQMSIFELIPFADAIKDVKERDIDRIILKGSGFQHGKFRILNFNNMWEPSISEFAKYLANEYGLGGCCLGDYRDTHNASGIEATVCGRKYKLSWPDVAKEIIKRINDNTYVTEKDLPRDEFYRPSEGVRSFTRKKFFIEDTSEYGRLVIAYLESMDEEPVNEGRKILYELCDVRTSFVYVGISELIAGIENGCYDTVEEVYHDLKRAGRMIRPTVFGGTKRLDREGVAEFLNTYKATGSCLGGKKQEDYTPIGWQFWSQRQRVKRGEISAEYLEI